MVKMQKITPHLWFDKEAKEAAEFYTSVFPKSKIKDTTTLHNTPSGSVDIVTVEISDLEFMLIAAGPLFRFTPAVSFLVACNTKEEVDALWGNSRKGVHRSWSLANTCSAKNTAGYRTGTVFRGR